MELLECQMRAAVQWIEHSREIIFRSLDNLTNLRDLRPGPLYTGKGGLSRERWDFWEARFRAFAVNGMFTEEFAFICDRAALLAAVAATTDVSDEQVLKETEPTKHSH